MLMPASCGVHGPGEITMRSGGKLLDFLDRRLVVAAHYDFIPHLPDVLHQVVSERIVVVQDKDHGNSPCSLDCPQQRTGFIHALLVFAFRIRVGDDARARLHISMPSCTTMVRIAMQESRLPA